MRVGAGRVVPLWEALGATQPENGAGKVDMAQWQTSLGFVTWGQEGRPASQPRLGFLAGRIYGGYALSRIP